MLFFVWCTWMSLSPYLSPNNGWKNVRKSIGPICPKRTIQKDTRPNQPTLNRFITLFFYMKWKQFIFKKQVFLIPFPGNVFRKSALEMNHRTNLVKTKSFFINTFENRPLRRIIGPIWWKRNHFSSIHSKDTG